MTTVLERQKRIHSIRFGKDNVAGKRMPRKKGNQRLHVTGYRFERKPVLQLAVIERNRPGDRSCLPIDGIDNISQVDIDFNRGRIPDSLLCRDPGVHDGRQGPGCGIDRSLRPRDG